MPKSIADQIAAQRKKDAQKEYEAQMAADIASRNGAGNYAQDIYKNAGGHKDTYTPTTGGAYQTPSNYTSTAGQLASELSNSSRSGGSSSNNTSVSLKRNQDNAIAKAKEDATASVNNILNKTKSNLYSASQARMKQVTPAKGSAFSVVPANIAVKLGQLLGPYAAKAKQNVDEKLNNDDDTNLWDTVKNLFIFKGSLSPLDIGTVVPGGGVEPPQSFTKTNKNLTPTDTKNTETNSNPTTGGDKTSPTGEDVKPKEPIVIDKGGSEDYTGGSGLPQNYDLNGAPYYLKEDVMDLLNAINDSIYSGKADVDSIYNDLYSSANKYVKDTKATNEQTLNSLGDVQATNRSDLLKALAANLASGVYRSANTGSTMANNVQIGGQYAQADQETTRNIIDSNAERLLAALKIRDVDSKNDAYNIAGNIQNGVDDVIANYLYGDAASMNNLAGTLAAINAEANRYASGSTLSAASNESYTIDKAYEDTASSDPLTREKAYSFLAASGVPTEYIEAMRKIVDESNKTPVTVDIDKTGVLPKITGSGMGDFLNNNADNILVDALATLGLLSGHSGISTVSSLGASVYNIYDLISTLINNSKK